METQAEWERGGPPALGGERRVKAGIIAAGEGSRLRARGWTLPKPLVPVRGVPLIEWTLRALHRAGVEQVLCLLNEASGPAVAGWVRERLPELSVVFLQRTTASSLESFVRVGQALGQIPFFIITVDAISHPQGLEVFLSVVAAGGGPDLVLGLSELTQGENPLWAQVDRAQRVLALGEVAKGSPYVTAGLYGGTGAVLEEAARVWRERGGPLRGFLTQMVERGFHVQGVPMGKVFDIDRPEDIRAAEQYLEAVGLL